MSDLDLICIWDHCSTIATCPICRATAEIERLETKVELYRKALADIGTWEQKSQDWVVKTDNGLGMWRGCIAVANMTLEEGGDAVEDREPVYPAGYKDA